MYKLRTKYNNNTTLGYVDVGCGGRMENAAWPMAYDAGTEALNTKHWKLGHFDRLC